MGDAANGSLSPDGSLVTMMGREVGGPGATRFVANADGTELRSIPGPRIRRGPGLLTGAGSSAFKGRGRSGIIVVRHRDGKRARHQRQRAIWLDGHTLLVEA